MTPEHATGSPSTTRSERIAAEPAEALAALLNLDAAPEEGGALPALWHWVYLLERRRQDELGPDGHPTRGIPAPPGPGRRRMFAGGRVTLHAPIVVDDVATKITSVVRTVEKQGRSGPLTFTTVLDEISQGDRLKVTEERDIVYRAPDSGGLAAGEIAPEPEPEPDRPALHLDVDEAVLFRFSALTYNAHRIHYDLPWARHEGYDGLVIHGPLQALLMSEVHRRAGLDLIGRTFSYRMQRPLIGCQQITAVSTAAGDQHDAELRGADGVVSAVSTVSSP